MACCPNPRNAAVRRRRNPGDLHLDVICHRTDRLLISVVSGDLFRDGEFVGFAVPVRAAQAEKLLGPLEVFLSRLQDASVELSLFLRIDELLISRDRRRVRAVDLLNSLFVCLVLGG